MKRGLSILLALSMLFCMIPSAFAAGGSDSLSSRQSKLPETSCELCVEVAATERNCSVCAALYDGNGRLLGVERDFLEEPEEAAHYFKLPAGSGWAKVFLLDEEGAPLCENLTLLRDPDAIAFGSPELHRYLMSLHPTECTPEIVGDDGDGPVYYDKYIFSGGSTAKIICDKLPELVNVVSHNVGAGEAGAVNPANYPTVSVQCETRPGKRHRIQINLKDASGNSTGYCSCYVEPEMDAILCTAPLWGLPETIEWIPDPQTDAELDSDILYAFLLGNYGLNFANMDLLSSIGGPKELAGFLRPRIKSLGQTYPELAGVFCNVTMGCGLSSGSVVIDFPTATLTFEQIYANQLAALEEARRVHALLSDTVALCKSDLEIAQVYYDYLWGLHVVPGHDSDTPRGKSVEYDTPYACLVNRVADCVGRAGALNLLLHLEGISAQGVAGTIIEHNSGHVLSRLVLDGQEYFCDWGNDRGIQDYAETEAWFAFTADSLAAARAIAPASVS